MILSLITIPYSYLNIRSALKNLDTSIEEVARSLGSSNLKTLGVVVLPQLRRSILSGMLIGVLYVITDFGAVSTLRVEVFTWVIYGSYRSGFSPERAAVLASLLFIIASAIVLAESIAGKKQKRTNAARVSHASKMLKLGKWNLLFQAVLALYFGSLVGVPLVRSMGWVFQYKSAVDPGDLIDPFTNTLFLGTAVVALGFVFAFSIALFSTYSKIGLFIEKLVTAFHGIPGIVTAIAMVYVGTRIVPAIYLEWPLVIVALCVAFSYLAIGPIKNSLEQHSLAYIENSYTLGKGKWGSMARITLPLSVQGVIAGSILVFVGVVKELPITLLLRPNGENTLATTMWSNISVSQYAVVAPTMLLLMGLCVLPLLFLVKVKYDR